MNAITGTLCATGAGLIVGLWGMNQLQKINPMSLMYIGGLVAGYLLLVIAMFTADAELFAFDNWPFQIIMAFLSIWMMKFFFGRKR